ncbi:MAG: hypothetical protein ACLQT6_12835 [Desulfomonilaceae bacterium]
MRSQLKASPTPREKLRKLGSSVTPTVIQPDEMGELNGVIDQMVSVVGALITKTDKTPNAETINNIYKLSTSLASLTRAKTDVKRLNLEIAGLHQRAIQSIRGYIQAELVGRPQLVNELIEVADIASEKAFKAEK